MLVRARVRIPKSISEVWHHGVADSEVNWGGRLVVEIDRIVGLDLIFAEGHPQRLVQHRCHLGPGPWQLEDALL